MTDERDEERAQHRRPRVVDKRVSARADDGGETSATPDPVAGPAPEPAPSPAAQPETGPVEAEAPGPPPGERVWTPEQEAEAQRLVEAMAATPALDWVLNSCVTLANVAGVKIDASDLSGARLAIDALGELVDGLGDRLGEAHAPLKTTLAQLQLAYAQAAGPPPEVRPS